MNAIRAFIEWNIRFSQKLDCWLVPERFRIDGNRDFIDNFASKYLCYGLKVYDIGGGKWPYIDKETKDRLSLKVVGLDIDMIELSRAPKGLYDETVFADITSFSGDGTADLVICQALLEHVKDVSCAFASIASILKPGGRAVIFVPSRNAVFARLNVLLPERWKRWILFTIFPQTRSNHGFASYYDHCTPSEFREISKRHALDEIDFSPYYQSTYFSFFFPAHLVWRLWVMWYWMMKGEQAAETFSFALAKRAIS
jgi:SAM-dependent methyltransferase